MPKSPLLQSHDELRAALRLAGAEIRKLNFGKKVLRRAGRYNRRMRPELLAHWNETGAMVEKHRALLAAKDALSPELLREIEDYWKGVAPPDQTFDPRRGVALLLHNVKRYEAALSRIAEKEREQKALMDHRAATGQEVTESDRQRWFAYLDIAHMAREALSPSGPGVPLENSEQDRREPNT